MKKSRLGAAVAVAAVLATSGGTAIAELSVATKINIAGKQRMLSQRVARAVCYQSLGIEMARHSAMVMYAMNDFEMALVGLGEGDWYKGMLPEENEDVLGKLGTLKGLWGPYSFALRKATQDPSAVERVASLATPVLVAANDVVVSLVQNRGEDVTDGGKDLARMINIAGRQRMLTQRAAKEFCMIAAGIAPEEHAAKLRETVDLFERSLNGLMTGDAEMKLRPPPDNVVLHQLEIIQEMWAPMRAHLVTGFDGRIPPQESLLAVAQGMDDLLAASNIATYLYESATLE